MKQSKTKTKQEGRDGAKSLQNENEYLFIYLLVNNWIKIIELLC